MAIKPDNRPRCDHGVVYPLDNCTHCMQEEINRLNTHIIAIGQKLYETQKELKQEQLKNNSLQLDVFRWFKYVEFKNLEKEDLNEYFVTQTLFDALFKNTSFW